jgi:transcriptional regulator with XRE-family HTH domain
MTRIGERIKDVRSDKQMSQQMLADSVGVTRATVSQWEIGDIKNLRPGNLLAVADALGISFRWLITGRGQKTNSPYLQAAEEAAQYNALSPDGIDLCRLWEKLPKEAREQARQFLYMLSILASLDPHLTLKNQPRNFTDFDKLITRSMLQKKSPRAA